VTKLLLRLAGGFALLAAVVWFVGPERITGALRRVEPAVFAAALALAVASNVTSAARWAAIARALGLAAPTPWLVPLYFRGMTSNTLLPGATVSGDLLRSAELARLGNPLLESAASVAFDRLSGLWTLCVLSFLAAGAAAAAGVTLSGAEGGQTVLASYGTALGLIVVAPFLPWPTAWLRRLPLAAAARLADLADRVRDPATGLRRRLAATLGLSLLVQLLSAGALAACGWSLGLSVTPLVMFAAAAPIFVMAALPLGIAGFGTRELAAVAVLGTAGVPADLAAGTGLLYGLCGVIQGAAAAPLFLLPSKRP
jgi:uncharacterized membrane protein YbhN (UPF0104 family)